MTGVRRILNNAANRALATRHAEAWYVATVLAAAAASWALLAIAAPPTDVPKRNRPPLDREAVHRTWLGARRS